MKTDPVRLMRPMRPVRPVWPLWPAWQALVAQHAHFGGSDLGPVMSFQALRHYRQPGPELADAEHATSTPDSSTKVLVQRDRQRREERA